MVHISGDKLLVFNVTLFPLPGTEVVDLASVYVVVEIKLFFFMCLNELMICFTTLLSDMLSQYAEVEQLGQIYVCDKCNGMTDVLYFVGYSYIS